MNVNQFPSIEQMTSQIGKVNNNTNTLQQNQNNLNKNGISFEEVLKSKTLNDDNRVIFSKHANERLESRNIELSDVQMNRLNEATKLAASKGIKESLVMLDDYNFIVNSMNYLVVTAIGKHEQNVFTNIDGAVIAQ